MEGGGAGRSKRKSIKVTSHTSLGKGLFRLFQFLFGVWLLFVAFVVYAIFKLL